jgi:hypothetical protein
LRSDHAVLGEVPAQRVDDLGALADEQIARPEDHSRCLLSLALDGHEAHGRALGDSANRLSVGRIVLLPLDERLDVGRRDQPHFVTEFADHPCPVMRARAGFHRHTAARQAREEGEHLFTPQPLAQHDPSGRTRAVDLEHVLG